MSGPKKPALGAAMTKVRGEAGPKDVTRRADVLAAECKALGVSAHAVTDVENSVTVRGGSPADALVELEQLAGVIESIRSIENRLPTAKVAAARRMKAELLTRYVSKEKWLEMAVFYTGTLLNTIAEAPAPTHTWKNATPTRARRSDSPPSGH